MSQSQRVEKHPFICSGLTSVSTSNLRNGIRFSPWERIWWTPVKCALLHVSKWPKWFVYTIDKCPCCAYFLRF